MPSRRYTLEVTTQPAYDLRKIEIDIFQEQGSRIGKNDGIAAKNHCGAFVRHYFMFYVRVARTYCFRTKYIGW